MSTSKEYVDFVVEQIAGTGEISSKKMFGEYMVYVDQRPILLVCDNTVYVKMVDCISESMKSADTGYPYEGAKLHYILDIEDRELTHKVIELLKQITPVSKPRKKA